MREPGFGALLVAVHDAVGKPDLRYAGRIGTGFDEEKLKNIYQQMKKLERDSSPLAHKLQSAQLRGVHFGEVFDFEFKPVNPIDSWKLPGNSPSF